MVEAMVLGALRRCEVLGLRIGDLRPGEGRAFVAEGKGTEHHRMLANGWCTRPAELDCSFETVCESCGFFATTVEFRPTLQRQADHAAAHDQPVRAALYRRLADGLGGEAS